MKIDNTQNIEGEQSESNPIHSPDGSFESYLRTQLNEGELREREEIYAKHFKGQNPYESTEEFIKKYNTFQMQFKISIVPVTILTSVLMGMPYILKWMNQNQSYQGAELFHIVMLQMAAIIVPYFIVVPYIAVYAEKKFHMDREYALRIDKKFDENQDENAKNMTPLELIKSFWEMFNWENLVNAVDRKSEHAAIQRLEDNLRESDAMEDLEEEKIAARNHNKGGEG